MLPLRVGRPEKSGGGLLLGSRQALSVTRGILPPRLVNDVLVSQSSLTCDRGEPVCTSQSPGEDTQHVSRVCKVLRARHRRCWGSCGGADFP